MRSSQISTPRNAIVAAALISAVALLFLAFAPSRLGGTVSYITIDGVSMLPAFEPDDLVIVREAGTYQVGDAVAYEHPNIGTVIHRIIDTDGDRFVLQGDNNDFLDTYHPTAGEILGREWIHIPTAGKYTAMAGRPWAAASMAALAAAVVFGGTLIPQRTRLRNPAPEVRVRQGGTMQTIARNWQDIATLGGILAIAGALLGLAAFTRGVETSAEELIPYTHEGAFAYHADTDSTDVYRDGASTGDPVYRGISDQLAVTFDYTLLSSASEAVAGTIALSGQVRGADGWTRELPIVPPVPFDAASASLGGAVRLAAIYDIIAGFEAATGASQSYTLVLRANVDVDATVAGQAVTGPFVPEIELAIREGGLFPAQTARSGFTTSEPGNVAMLTTSAATLPLGFTSLAVGTARLVAGALLAVATVVIALTVIAVSTAASATGLRGQGLGKYSKYASMLVSVHSHRHVPQARLVDVADFDGLACIAERQGTVILHAEDGGEHLYFVVAHDATFRYAPALAETVAAAGRTEAPA